MTAPVIDCDKHHPLLLVEDIPAAVDFYTSKLGFTLGFLWGNPPNMAGVNLGNVSIHLQQNGPVASGNAVYFVVGNADELYEYQRKNGAQITVEPGDRPYGLRDYSISDPYGNTLAFGHYIYHVGEPIKIERVDVPVRLEKRLAAVLYDLAKYKGMSINSCLEETLLHTFEMDDKGNGVSPHNPGTMRYIQELKKKHGIDYDSHGSYLFVE
jgi:catechol 2,3-dioxygenase-like lactoylglutathione lyase family enzyme